MKSTRYRPRPAVALLFGLACLAVVSGCRPAPPRPDVLLVTIDTLRSDHCSAYGYPVATTPNLDAMAGTGVLYRRAYSEASTTAPSHAVLMTGRHFRSLGVTKNSGVVPAEAVTLAEALGGAGYATAAFVSIFPLTRLFGFDQGFEFYDEAFTMAEASLGTRKEGEEPHERLGAATLEHVRRWLEQRKDNRPLFLWVHFVDPHSPYNAPVGFETTWPVGTSEALRKYDAEVHYADAQLGRLLKLVESRSTDRGQLEVVTSDHGEGLGDHGWLFHGINLYEEAVRVPLVARWAGHLPEGKVEEGLVGLIDVAPGILDLLGIEAESFAQGRNLFAPADPARSIFLQRRDYKSTREEGRLIAGEMTAVVKGTTKFILAPGEGRRELYDLGADPDERRDLLSPSGPGLRAGRGALPGTAPGDPEVTKSGEGDEAVSEPNTARALAAEAELGDWRHLHPQAKPRAPVSQDTLQALRSLGYVD